MKKYYVVYGCCVDSKYFNTCDVKKVEADITEDTITEWQEQALTEARLVMGKEKGIHIVVTNWKRID